MSHYLQVITKTGTQRFVMASFDLDHIKHISESKQLLVHGFIREFEENQSNATIIIPDLIVYTCLLFWYRERIFTDPCNSSLVLAEDGCAFQKVSGEAWNNSIFGKEWMNSHDSVIHIFNIETKKAVKDYNGIAVGIISNKHSQNVHLPFFDGFGYGIFNSGKWGRIDRQGVSMQAIKWREGATLRLIIDFDKRQIRGYKNEQVEDVHVMFEDLKTGKDIQYKLAISLFHVGISISVSHHIKSLK